jgi:phytoene desaturase
MQVAVVGAGLGGLSAACHLVGAGHDVLVLEKGDRPGGRCGLWEAEGFRIDTGPSVLTMTGILSDVFASAGADMGDHLSLLPVDPMYRATFPASVGGEMQVRHGRPAMTEEIRDKCGAKEAEAFGRFCDWLTQLYGRVLPDFINRNFDGILSIAKPLWPAIDLVRLGGFRKLANVVQSYFDDPRLVQLFSFQSLYAGLSPFDALAVYSVITYMDTVEGVYFPQGGMHAVARGLAGAAEKGGATFRYGVEVERVVRRTGTSGPAVGVRLSDGELIRADAVVLNPDLPVAYRTLLPEVSVPWKARRGEYSPSCALWLAGVRGAPPPGVAHHNIHFGDYDSAFKALIKDGDLQPDPSILVSLQNHTDPTLAPEGCTTIYALEPTPNLDGRPDWTFERDRVKERLLGQLRAHGYPVDDVVVERFLDPTDWERQGMERGAPFALSHRFLQTGPFRPSNVDSRIPGVVFVGSGTQPGVGVPIVLLSGRLAAERVDELRSVRA